MVRAQEEEQLKGNFRKKVAFFVLDLLMQILDIKQESYFPQNFKIFGFILMIGTLLSFISVSTISILRIIISLSVLVLGGSMVFTRYGLEINPVKKTYTIYTHLLGLKFGKPVSFHFIDKFYINQVTEQALATTRTGAKFDLKKKIYKAFIRLDNGEKIHLDTDKNEKKLKGRLDEYKNILASIYIPSE